MTWKTTPLQFIYGHFSLFSYLRGRINSPLSTFARMRNEPNLGILSPSGIACMKELERFERCADRLKAFTDPGRLKMIDFLFQGEATVSSLAGVVGQQITMASHHLSVLLKAGVVTSRRDGRFVYYSLHPNVVRRKDDKLLRQINLVDCTVDFDTAAYVSSLSEAAEPRAD